MKIPNDSTVPELDLGALREDIAAIQRPVVESAARLRHARNRLLLDGPSVAPTRAAWRRHALRWTPFAMAAGAAVILALWWGRAERTLTFESGVRGVAATLGTPVRAPADTPVPLRFSDGSSLTIAPGSQLTVAQVGSSGAGLVLNEGSLMASIVHRASSRWRVLAGPYVVAVTGTRFAVEWHPPSRSFHLTLHEGAVTVYGPSLGTGGRRVAPHETVHLGPDTAPVTESLPTTAPTVSAERDRVPVQAAPPSPGRSSWKRLAQAGRYADALAAAEVEGFATLCQRAPIAELLLLGNTARFARQPERAESAFRAIRARAGASHQSAVAAFELGRLAHDVHHRYHDSAEWFAVYLREEAGGALAHEASGRKMEALHRAGEVAAAAEAAKSYRRLYPGGAYEGLARQLAVPGQ